MKLTPKMKAAYDSIPEDSWVPLGQLGIGAPTLMALWRRGLVETRNPTDPETVALGSNTRVYRIPMPSEESLGKRISDLDTERISLSRVVFLITETIHEHSKGKPEVRTPFIAALRAERANTEDRLKGIQKLLGAYRKQYMASGMSV